jgi:hypothetical protein
MEAQPQAKTFNTTIDPITSMVTRIPALGKRPSRVVGLQLRLELARRPGPLPMPTIVRAYMGSCETRSADGYLLSSSPVLGIVLDAGRSPADLVREFAPAETRWTTGAGTMIDGLAQRAYGAPPGVHVRGARVYPLLHEMVLHELVHFNDPQVLRRDNTVNAASAAPWPVIGDDASQRAYVNNPAEVVAYAAQIADFVLRYYLDAGHRLSDLFFTRPVTHWLNDCSAWRRVEPYLEPSGMRRVLRAAERAYERCRAFHETLAMRRTRPRSFNNALLGTGPF